MSLEVFTIREAKKWDEIVKSFKNYDVYWLSGYVKAFELHGDGKPLLFYYHDKNTRGINVVMKRKIDIKLEDKKKYYDITTPYGYGGWLIEGHNTQKLFKEYEKWLSDKNIISEFVRFHPLIKNHSSCKDIYDIVELGEVVHIELKSQEDVWNNMTSKNRNMVRKAIKNGVIIKTSKNIKAYRQFKQIYNETMDKDNASEYYYFKDDFYKSIQNDLNKNATVYYAEKENQVIASTIILSANKRLNYHLSGSKKAYGTLAPTNLLLYRVAIDGLNNGYDTLYLGGGVGSQDDGLLKFKKSFNKTSDNKFYIGKKIWNHTKYIEICRLLKADIDNGYFPAYRKAVK